MRCPATEDFKANLTDDSTMAYMLSSILMRQRSVQRTRLLFDHSRYDTDHQPAPSSSQQRPSKPTQRLDSGQSSRWFRPVTRSATPRSRLRTAASSTGRRTSATSTSASFPGFSTSSISQGSPIDDDVPLNDTPPESAATCRPRRPPVPAGERFCLRITGEAESDNDDEEKPEVADISPSPPPAP